MGLQKQYVHSLAKIINNLAPEEAALLIALAGRAVVGALFEMITNRNRIIEILIDYPARFPGDAKSLAAELRRIADEAEKISPENKLLKGEEVLLDLLDCLSPDIRTEALDQIREKASYMEAELKKKLISFEELASLNDHTLQMILRHADLDTLIAALQGEEKVQECVYKNLKRTTRDQLQEDIAFLPPLPETERRYAQQEILRLVRKLDRERVIFLG